jgi:hypothetical protein
MSNCTLLYVVQLFPECVLHSFEHLTGINVDVLQTQIHYSIHAFAVRGLITEVEIFSQCTASKLSIYRYTHTTEG